MTGTYDTLKVKLLGQLKEGWLLVVLVPQGGLAKASWVFSGAFQKELRFPVEVGEYALVFRLEKAKGWVRYDWVATKFAP